MKKKVKFFQLNEVQMKRFAKLKTSNELAFHGPLDSGQKVPVHIHQEAALYVVSPGEAELRNGAKKKLGKNYSWNAVLVPASVEHGWLSLADQTLIEHTFGQDNIDKVTE